jgi:hypothetical protein
MNKAAGLVVLVVAILVLGLGLPGCIGDKAYYSRHQTTVEDLQRTWGYPYTIGPWQDGAEVYIYPGNDEYFQNRYFIIKDGVVIDGGVGLQR